LTVTLTVVKDERQCEAKCPTHGTQCRLKNFEQQAYPMHAHSQDGRMCLWKK
jgi:hypothetical protein